jgi:hypothetical protein
MVIIFKREAVIELFKTGLVAATIMYYIHALAAPDRDLDQLPVWDPG